MKFLIVTTLFSTAVTMFHLGYNYLFRADIEKGIPYIGIGIFAAYVLSTYIA